jgi:surface polysaccharide O-acyltransferase-like enzyme
MLYIDLRYLRIIIIIYIIQAIIYIKNIKYRVNIVESYDIMLMILNIYRATSAAVVIQDRVDVDLDHFNAYKLISYVLLYTYICEVYLGTP